MKEDKNFPKAIFKNVLKISEKSEVEI